MKERQFIRNIPVDQYLESLRLGCYEYRFQRSRLPHILPLYWVVVGGRGENFAGAARYADAEHWIEKWIMSPAEVLNQHP
jgi:hypothetical protein